MKVLIVEDNPGDIRLIEEMLKENKVNSWEVERAGSLAEGLKSLDGGEIDIVLLDLGLPDSMGLDTLRKFLSHRDDVPVVVLTGVDAEYMGVEAIRAGAQDYLVKGKVDPDMLSRTLNYASERAYLATRLRESEETYRKLTMTSPDAIIVSDLEGDVTFFSKRGLELFGYESSYEALGRNAINFFDPEDHRRAASDLRILLREGKLRDVEYVMRRKDGSTFVGELSCTLLMDKNDRPQAIVSVARDITDRKRAWERVDKLNRLFLGLGVDIISNIEAVLNEGCDILDVDTMKYCRLQHGKLASILFEHGSSIFTVSSDCENHLCNMVIRGSVDDGPVIASDLLGSPQYADYEEAERYGHMSYAGYPVRVGMLTIGCLSAYGRGGREFSKDELETLGTLAQIISIEEERLAREEKLKDFIDIASHELRHPITVMKAYAILLKEKGDMLDEMTRMDTLEAIDRAADNLNFLAVELLDTARIERGEFILSRSEVSLRELIDESLRMINNGEKGNTFSINVDEGVGMLRVDREKITQLISTLLDNAIKFSSNGSEIEIDVKIIGNEVVTSVMDRGEGVPEEERERIFERFYHVGEARHHSIPGIGLGLYIARQAAEAHGGRIWYEPREGGGSSFIFTIPMIQ